MAGLADLLPYVYSRGNALRRGLTDMVQNPVASLQQTAGLIQDKGREQQNVLAQAFADPREPFRVTDKAALNQATQNVLAGPLGFAPVGMTRAEALETARRNAVQMLGLPEGNTPMDRARAMGFETAPSKWTYHGSRAEINGPIDPARSDFGFHTGSVEQAEARLKAFAPPTEVFPEGANMLPLMKSRYANMLRVADEGSFHADALAPQLAKKGLIDKAKAKQMVKDIEADWKKQKEYDDILRRVVNENDYHGVVYSNAQEGAGKSYAFSDPSVLRSPFAAFDPARAKERDLLGYATPSMLSLLGLGAAGTAYVANEKAGK
jgi:hypothetical protein